MRVGLVLLLCVSRTRNGHGREGGVRRGGGSKQRKVRDYVATPTTFTHEKIPTAFSTRHCHVFNTRSCSPKPNQTKPKTNPTHERLEGNRSASVLGNASTHITRQESQHRPTTRERQKHTRVLQRNGAPRPLHRGAQTQQTPCESVQPATPTPFCPLTLPGKRSRLSIRATARVPSLPTLQPCSVSVWVSETGTSPSTRSKRGGDRTRETEGDQAQKTGNRES